MQLFARPDMSGIAGYLIIAFVLVAGVLGLSVCFEGLGAECGHLCCTGAGRSRPLGAFARRLYAAILSAIPTAAFSPGVAWHQLFTAFTSPTLPPALLKVSALRI